MHWSRTTAVAGLVAALSLANVACKEEGPAEEAGRAIDEAAENVQEGVQELTKDEGAFEKAGEATDEAIDKAKEMIEEATGN
jgi:Protein of unknown function (DUF1090)